MKNLMNMVAVTLVSVQASAFDGETAAFYAFTDGEAGLTPTTLLNAVDSTRHQGTATIYKYNAAGVGVMSFDADAPGKYLFDDVSTVTPTAIAQDVQSIHITSETDNYSGGNISFAEIGSMLSGEDEFTIEFFYKLPSTEAKPKGAYAANMTVDVGAGKAINVCTPLTSASDTTRCKYINVFPNGSPWGQSAILPATPLGDDQWHHCALVYSGSVFKVYADYDYSVQMSGTWPLTRLESPAALVFGSGSIGSSQSPAIFHGKVCAVKVTKKALDKNHFLHASDKLHYNFDRTSEEVDMPNAIAFYTFKEGEGKVGEDAIGAKFLNDVDGDTFLAEAQQTGTLTYDDEAPGKYVFDGIGYGKTIVASNVMSLCFNNSTVKFTGLATAISKCKDATIEVFWKIDPTDAIPGYKSSFAPQVPFKKGNAGDARSPAVYMPLASLSDAARSKYVRYWESTLGVSSDATYPTALNDGKWHHTALVYSEDSHAVKYYADYKLVATVADMYMQELVSDTGVLIGQGFVGRFACLRASDKALSADELLRASSCRTCQPETLVRYRLGGPAETSPSAIANSAPSFRSANPRQFTWDEEESPAGVPQSNGNSPVWSAASAGAHVVEEGVPLDADGSLRLVPTDVTTDKTFVNGPSFHTARECYLTTSQTIEGFFRFDPTTYANTVVKAFPDRDRCSIVNLNNNKSIPVWSLYVNNALKQSAALYLVGKTADGQSFSTNVALGSALNARWHRFVVVYDEKIPGISVWLDCDKVIDLPLAAKLDFTDARYYVFGDGGNNQPFAGLFDEIRISCGTLPPSRFLSVIKLGMVLIVK